jgi:hypothetical protein
MRIATLLLLSITIGVTTAHATPPCECYRGFSVPEDGSTSVPTNAALFVAVPGIDPSAFALRQGNVTVPLEIDDTHAESGGVWFRPGATLSPNTNYTFVQSSFQTTFTTGSADDSTAPAMSSPKIIGSRLEGSCDRNTVAEVQANASDDETPASSMILKVTIDNQDVYLPASSPLLGESAIGNSSCLATFPTARAGQKYTAVVTAFDRAGNASAESAPIDFQFQDNGATGCSMAPHGAEATGLALLLSAVLLFITYVRRA